MHGIILAELKKYVDTKHGKDTWRALLKNAGLGARVYVHIRAYPDEEVMAIVAAASSMTGQAVPAILEDFGEFIAPDLLSMYRRLIQPEWRTLDVIEHTEATIHRVVRLNEPDASPPEIACHRPDPNEVVITYTSARKMCGVAKGIARALARHYNERIIITESSCMLKGGSACVISVKLVKAAMTMEPSGELNA